MESVFKKITSLYSGNLAKYGDQSKAVGWKTPESQKLRFDKLTSVIEDKSKPVTINDYGCGYCAYLDYLVNNGFNVIAYNGYDLSTEMLQEAKLRLSWFKGEMNLIQSSEITTQADYTFVSGTFNVRFESTDNDWEKFIKGKLAEISQFSSLGFSFNLLSKYVDWRDADLFYADPCFWFDHVKVNLARKVNILHDYPLYEWTIIVQKDVQ